MAREVTGRGREGEKRRLRGAEVEKTMAAGQYF